MHGYRDGYPLCTSAGFVLGFTFIMFMYEYCAANQFYINECVVASFLPEYSYSMVA